MKKNKTRNIIIGLIVIAVLVWIWYKYFKPVPGTDLNTTTKVSGGTSGSNTSSGTPAVCTNQTVLKKGSKCDRVQWSQYEINRVANKLGISKLSEDGVFGSKTEAAFKKLLGKNTGSYAEVFNKVKSLLGTSAGSSTFPGVIFVDGIKW